MNIISLKADNRKTAVPQLYRLLDPANTGKSMKQLVALLHVLDCDVDLVVRIKKGSLRGTTGTD